MRGWVMRGKCFDSLRVCYERWCYVTRKDVL